MTEQDQSVIPGDVAESVNIQVTENIETSVVAADGTVDAISTDKTEKRVRRPRIVKDGEVKPRTPRIKRTGDEMADFKTWLGSLELGVSPTIHVNGAEFTDCVLTLDFGTPLKGIKLTPEQSTEVATRLRNVTRLVMQKDVKIGVNTDHSNGVWWTNIV